MDEKVTKYIDKQKSPQKEICKKLRKIVLKTFPSIQEGMKWGVPSFDDGKLYFVALKNHVNFGFLTKGFSKKEQLKASEDMFLETIEEIGKGKFKPNVTPLCDWCGYQKICPMWRHKFKEERKVESQEAEKAIEEFLEIKSAMGVTRDRLAKLQEKILNYMEQEGVERVFGERGIVAKSLRKTYKYDKKKLKEILKPLRKWEDALKVDGVALRQILGSLPSEARRKVEKAKEIDRETSSLIVKKK